MAAEGGLVCPVRIKISGSYTPLGAVRTRTIKINNGPMVDISSSDSTGRWRELLAGVSIGSMQMQVTGVFKGSTVDAALAAAATPGQSALTDMEVFIPGLGTYQALWQVSDYSIDAPHDKEVTYSCTLDSGGAVTVTTPGS